MAGTLRARNVVAREIGYARHFSRWTPLPFTSPDTSGGKARPCEAIRTYPIAKQHLSGDTQVRVPSHVAEESLRRPNWPAFVRFSSSPPGVGKSKTVRARPSASFFDLPRLPGLTKNVRGHEAEKRFEARAGPADFLGTFELPHVVHEAPDVAVGGFSDLPADE